MQPTQDLQGAPSGAPSLWADANTLPLVCNVPDEILYANMQRAVDAGYPAIELHAAHGGIAVIVGGGPSAADSVEVIRQAQKTGATVFALNGAGHWLVSQGIAPDALILLDARPFNARFVQGLPKSVRLYIASQCDKAVFDAGEGRDLLIWHPPMGGKSGVIDPRRTPLIGGGTSVGMRSLHLAYCLGFRTLHLFGFDSSYRDGQAHMYAQPENDADALRTCTVNGEEFTSCGWMIRQADDFQQIAADMINNHGVAIHAHGDGLLPAVARAMMKTGNPASVVYDLGAAPASYDFLAYIVNAEMDRLRSGTTEPLKVYFKAGPNEGFRADNLPLFTPDKQQMMANVVRPALALIGAVEADTLDPEASWPEEYTYAPVVRAVRRGEPVPKFTPKPEAVQAVDEWLAAKGIANPIVITLRESRHWPHRNSSMLAWLRFSEFLVSEGEQVLFVRDTAKADEMFSKPSYPEASKDIHIRAALYARAKCNLFTANGPAGIAFFLDAPWLMFGPLDPTGQWAPGTDAWWRRFHGIGMGEQFPWSRPDQRIVWLPDSYGVLMDSYRQIKPLLNRS